MAKKDTALRKKTRHVVVTLHFDEPVTTAGAARVARQIFHGAFYVYEEGVDEVKVGGIRPYEARPPFHG